MASRPCPHCGRPTRANAKFCAHCGKPIAASPPQSTSPHPPLVTPRSAAPATPPDTVVCKRCGAMNRLGARFCARCANPLSSSTSTRLSQRNLLQLYSEQHTQVETLRDPFATFVLAYIQHVGHISINDLARDLGLTTSALRARLDPLLQSKLLIEGAAGISVLPLGAGIVGETGIAPPTPPPPAPPQKPPAQPPRPPSPPATAASGVPGWILPGLVFVGLVTVAIGIAIFSLIVPTPTPTPVPPTQPPATAVPAPTHTPTLVPTDIPTRAPAPTDTPTPIETVVDAQLSFFADRTVIRLGECATLSWVVIGGDWVELNGQRAKFSDSLQVCPPDTQTFALVVGIGSAFKRELKRSEIVITVLAVPTPPPSPPSPTRAPTITPSRTPTVTRTVPPTTVKLTPVADAFVISGCPTFNNNGEIFSVAGNYGDPDCPGRARAFTRFSLAAIPPNQIIQNATYYAYVKNGAAGATTIQVDLVLSAWNETTLNWNNQPTNILQNFARTSVGTSGWHSWNVTLPVLEWYGGKSENNGIRLVNTNENSPTINYRTFYSRHAVSTPFMPYLEITYHP